MKKHFNLFLLLYILFFSILNCSVLFSQTETQTIGKYSFETVIGDPLKARIYKLANGLTVYMTVYKNEPRIQTYIPVKAGSKLDPAEATGLGRPRPAVFVQRPYRAGQVCRHGPGRLLQGGRTDDPP